MKIRWGCFVACILTFFFLNSACTNKIKKNGEIHIAVIGPTQTPAGKSQIKGVTLFVDRINKNGGINGKQVIIDRYDDQNDKNEAQKKALEIVEDNQAVAVIGHISSAISISGGKIYEEHEIPAVSPSSTSDDVSKSNEWYFTSVFNNSVQGKYLAHYTKNVLGVKAVSIIKEDALHSSGIAEVFEREANQIGLEILFNREFKVGEPGFEAVLEDIASGLKKQVKDSAVFIGAHPNEGVKVVKAIRDAGIDNQIVGPTAFSSWAFHKEIEAMPEEKKHPGRYTGNLFISVPLIFDTANARAQCFKKEYLETFNELPDWRAAFAYDTAKVILTAIEMAAVTGSRESIKQDRKKIRDTLKSISCPEKAIAGATGLNYFDANGNSPKSLAIGIYRNGNIISAQTQLRYMRHPNLIPHMKKALLEKRIIAVNNDYMYRTNVVYTGIEVNSISDLDIKQATCMIDFYIWFRYEGMVDAQNIFFLNSVDPITLPPPSGNRHKEQLKTNQKYKAEFVRESRSGGLTTRLYHVRAKFRIESQFNGNAYTIGFSFHHSELSCDYLIFVTDILGMGLSENRRYLKQMKSQGIPVIDSNWRIHNIRFFQKIDKKGSKGDPWYLNRKNKFIEYSLFNFNMVLKNDTIYLRRTISAKTALYLTVICPVLVLCFISMSFCRSFKNHPRTLWIFQAVPMFLFLLCSEVTVFSSFPELEGHHKKIVILIFDILWWVMPAIFIHLGFRPFVWGPLERHSGRPTPNAFLRLPVYITCFVAGYGIIVFVFGFNVTRIMTTSGILAMTVGFFIKDSIANFFASVSIIQGYDIKIGHWIEVNGFDQGKVEEITKQVTRIRTRDGALLNIPNSVVLKSIIKNYGCFNGLCR